MTLQAAFVTVMEWLGRSLVAIYNYFLGNAATNTSHSAASLDALDYSSDDD